MHRILLLLIALGIQTTVNGAWVIWSDNFESGSHSSSIASTLAGQIVDNPFMVGINTTNKVLMISDATNTSPWGEVRFNNGNGGSLLLDTYGAVPGVDKFTFSLDYFIPASTVSVSNDSLTLITRVSLGANSNPFVPVNSSGVNTTTATKGVWSTLTYTVTIPLDYDTSTSGNQTPLYITPLIALSDSPTNGTGDNNPGLWIYYDNIRFSVTPEPQRAILLGLGIGALLLKRRRASHLGEF